MEQEQLVGFDVLQAETSVCVVDGAGKVAWQGKCASMPESMAAVVQRRAPHATKIALGTGSMSAWHYRRLAAPGLCVLCIDARHAKAVLAMRLNKTDANNAVGLAQIVRAGWYRELTVESEHGHRTWGLGDTYGDTAYSGSRPQAAIRAPGWHRASCIPADDGWQLQRRCVRTQGRGRIHAADHRRRAHHDRHHSSLTNGRLNHTENLTKLADTIMPSQFLVCI